MAMLLNSEIQNFKQLKQILPGLWVPEGNTKSMGGKSHFEPNQCTENTVVYNLKWSKHLFNGELLVMS